MKQYTVTGTATGKVTVSVAANSKEEALQLAYGEFYLGNMKLDTDSVNDLDFNKAQIKKELAK